MLRTNSKKVKENVRQYIIDNYDIDGYDNHKEELKTGIDFDSVKENIKYIFNLEYGNCAYNLRKGMYQAWKDYCQGLPSVLDTCYYYNRSAIKDLGDILEETEEERNKFTEEQAEEQLTRLIYREIFCS